MEKLGYRPELSIIIVNWNGGQVVINCLESLLHTVKKHRYEIIVVDNNSTDGTPKLIENKFPKIKLIQNSFNNYFSGGNNQGYAAAQGNLILLLNPDIVAPEGSVDRLVDCLIQNNLPILTGKLVNLNGSVQNTMYRSFPSAAKLLASGLSVKIPLLKHLPLVKDYLSINRDFHKDFYVEQAPGAVILMRRELIEKLHYLFDDHNFPLFYNDVDLSYRIKKQGYKILCKTDIPFYHLKQHSLNRLKFFEYGKSYCISSLKYFNKHKFYFDYLVLRLTYFVIFELLLLGSFIQMLFGRITKNELINRKAITSKILKIEF